MRATAGIRSRRHRSRAWLISYRRPQRPEAIWVDGALGPDMITASPNCIAAARSSRF